jgi:SAM-dependent methyltransferase
MEAGFEWDESLYAGTARFYVIGRLPYPQAMADAIASELRLDGSGRLLDVGCGPGSVALLVSSLFEVVVGVDPDRGMVEEAERQADRRDVANAEWHVLRAEDLPAGLGSFRVATFAQSFHWMDRRRVAAVVIGMLEPGGAWVHVHATTHRGTQRDGPPLPRPEPPRDRIDDLVRAYLGPVRRAGRGVLPKGPPSGEDEILAATALDGPHELTVGGGRVLERTEDEVVASVFSLSSSTPHLFGERAGEFEADLRRLLREAAPDGRFSERTREIGVSVWRVPETGG